MYFPPEREIKPVSDFSNIVCSFLLSSPPNSSSQVKFEQGFKSRTNFSFEFATGGGLFDCVLAKGKFTEHDVVTVICSVLVDYLHHRGVVHRDLKYTFFPLNLLPSTTSTGDNMTTYIL